MNRDTLDLLSQVPLLAELDAEALGALVAQASVRSYRASTVIIEKGDEASALYVVLSGRVRVFSADDRGKEYVLNELGPGDYLGELALIDDAPARRPC